MVALTEAGKAYLAPIELILEALDEANHAVRDVKGLHGVLRLHAPSSVANREIAPRLPRYLEHPALRIDLRVADVQPDVARAFVGYRAMDLERDGLGPRRRSRARPEP